MQTSYDATKLKAVTPASAIWPERAPRFGVCALWLRRLGHPCQRMFKIEKGLAWSMDDAATIVRRLKHSDSDVRLTAVRALGKLEPAALGPFARKLSRGLDEAGYSENVVRTLVLEALGKLEPWQLAPLVGAIVRRLDDVDSSVRRAALDVLGGVLDDADSSVRLSALEELGKVEPTEVICPRAYSEVIAGRLVDSDSNVRAAAVELLASIEPAALAAHAEAIARRLEDSDWRVRVAAIKALGQFEPSALDSLAGALVRRSKDYHAEVQQAAVAVLRTLNPVVLAAHAEAIVQRLDQCDLDGRSAAVELLDRGLGSLEPAALASHTAVIMHLLEQHSDSRVQMAAFRAFGKLPPSSLCPHGEAIVRGIEDDEYLSKKDTPSSDAPLWRAYDSAVRRAAVEALGTLEPTALAPHADAIVRRLEDLDEYVREAAIIALGVLEPAVLAEYVFQISKRLPDTERVRAAAVAVLLSLLDRMDQRHAHLLDRATAKGETALHMAAVSGELAVCQRLVDFGVRVKPSYTGRVQEYTPEELAQGKGHHQIVHFLQSRSNLTTVRGGIGNAFEAAMQDDRSVTSLTWHQLPLPGSAGAIGHFILCCRSVIVRVISVHVANCVKSLIVHR